MNEQQLFDVFLSDVHRPFSGWDFSYLTATGRMVEAPLPWSYASIVLPRLRSARALPDMGTGGGKFLSRLQPLPSLTYATEGYAPNVPIARERLEPLGVKVYEVENDDHLPFDNEQFDLVINRHESYSPREVLRVLQTSGSFITQQAGGQDGDNLHELLGVDPYQYAYWTLDYAVSELQQAGWHILEQRETLSFQRFYDRGAIAYYLKVIPWQIPDFSIEKYRDKLIVLHNHMQEHGYFDYRMHRFLILAQK